MVKIFLLAPLLRAPLLRARLRQVLLCGMLLCCIQQPAAADTNDMPDTAYTALQWALSDRPDVPAAFRADLTRWQTQHLDICRQPLQYRYFYSRFARAAEAGNHAMPGTGAPACTEPVPFMVQTPKKLETRWIDPSRVRAIHLVYAGKGKGSASRFGHVALQLIICPAPDAAETEASDAACASNLREHLLLGFMAHVDTFEIDVLKGLSGDYRARLFASPFLDAYRGYAIDEFRELYSVPLKLSNSQRGIIIRELSQIHWQYSGEYSFFGNNCASLLQRALRALLPTKAGRPALHDKRIRPDQLFQALLHSGLLESEHINNKTEAEKQGYFFPSTRPYYAKAFTGLSRALENFTFPDLESYLATAPVQRAAMLMSEKNNAVLEHDPHLGEAALILEELSLTREARRFSAGLAQMLSQSGMDKHPERFRARLDTAQQEVFDRCLLQPAKVLADPGPRHNGIPLPADIPVSDAPFLSASCMEGDSPRQLKAVLTVLAKGNEKRWQAIDQAADNWRNTITTVMQLEARLSAAKSAAKNP